MKCKASGIGALIVRFRQESGLTQADLSKDLSYSSPQFVSNWERGIARPPMKALLKLAKKRKFPVKEMRDVLVKEYRDKVDSILKLT